MTKYSNKKIEGGEVQNNLPSNPLHLYLYTLKNSLLIDTNFSEYRLVKNFYTKNSKFILKDLSGIDSCDNT
jgi:hypothetical protein